MKDEPGCYEFLPHTADAKFKAYGKSMDDCFRNAARAMFVIMTDIEAVRPALRFPIRLKASNRQAALFDFLDRLIFLLDTEGFLLHDCEQMRVTRNCDGTYWVTGEAVGDFHRGYDVGGNVKAVTYNDMTFERKDDQWECQVVVDI